MAFVHGKGTFVSIDADDMSAYSANVTFNRTVDSHDVTTFGKDAHVFAGGLVNGTATISGTYDNTASTGPSAVFQALIDGAAVVELIYRPEGTGSSLPERSVDALVTGYTETSPVAGMVTWQANLQLSDDVDLTAQSA